MRRRYSWTILGIGALALAACEGGGSVGGNTGGGGSSSSSSSGGTVPQMLVDKVDIVLGIDNSRSMADKQEILSVAISDMIQALTNPPCLDANQQSIANQPLTGQDVCPEGSARQYLPINDIHIGIVSSSIGGHGSDACPGTETYSCSGGATNTTNNDRGHLVTRSDPCAAGMVATYQDKGFLAWDPTTSANSPPGETDVANLTQGIRDLVVGAGQIGCGYESQLESWYRFLVDPEPYNSIVLDSSERAVPQGTDQALLQQRAAFLRPDSLLAILMLSDENDCSTKEYGQFYFSSQQRELTNTSKAFRLPRARQECATNPNDPCCRSCGQDQTGCPVDPTCVQDPTLSDAEDNVNLRCWDQKRRFGIDFLYPVDRYVNGLSSSTVPNRAGDLVANPIFSNLNPTAYPNAQLRDPGLVVLGGIVGVPWQDLARDPSDLTKGYKNAEELAHADGGVTTWDVILGEPTNYVAPLDPHMIESPYPRSGTNPITGTSIAPTGSAAGTDPISGHEYTPDSQSGPYDLQYACIFPLAQPQDCSDPNVIACDCLEAQNDNPLCEPDPANNNARTLQVRAKAYPGIRQLNVIRDLGPQGVAGSICPAQQTDPSKADYAYRPSIQALITRVASRLKTTNSN